MQIGPFKVDFFHVCHSVPDGVGLGIETPAGIIVHTGDYKFDHTPVDGLPTDYGKLAELGGRGVLALLADSTNAERPGWTPSERVIDTAFDRVFKKAQGRIIIATFASLISRIQQVLEVAKRYDRKVCFAGLSMVENAKIAKELGYLQYDENQIVGIDQALSMPISKVVLMVTGSQGEPTSILGRLANGTNRQFTIQEGDTVVLSSSPIPGNEEGVYRAINRLMEQGADVVYSDIEAVHVSGHASQEEMKLLLHLVRPRYLIPVHGETRMLRQHKRLAMELGMEEEQVPIVQNGRVIELSHGELKLGERIPGGYVYVDGTSVGNIDNSTIRDRAMLSQDGVLLINLSLDKDNGSYKDLELISRGFIGQEAEADLFEELRKRIHRMTLSPAKNMQKEIQNLAISYLNEETKRRPYIFVTISKV